MASIAYRHGLELLEGDANILLAGSQGAFTTVQSTEKTPAQAFYSACSGHHTNCNMGLPMSYITLEGVEAFDYFQPAT